MLLVAAGLVVLVERWRRVRRLVPTAAGTDVRHPEVVAAQVLDESRDSMVPVSVFEGTDEQRPAVVAGSAVPWSGAFAAASSEGGEMAVNFMGRRQFVGLVDPPSRILEAILAYLLFHEGHHLSADQILLAMWPFGRSQGELKPKTLLNYLSQLRAWVGAEHLPDAVLSGGYLIIGIAVDWSTFRRLCAEADTLGGSEARALRTQALELVRGRPFEGLSGDGYDWVDDERLIGTMTKAIVGCATALATDLMEGGDFTAAHDAVDAALRGARNEYALWELGARALWSRGDRTALVHWLDEAVHHLEPSDVERIRAGLSHQDPSAS
jgi:DNA-binding SARP family transcriptional activator